MRRVFSIGAWLLALALLLVPVARAADGLQWWPLDRLPETDRSLADAFGAPFWGPDEAHWPDWIDPRGLWVPTRHGETLLVVRIPWHAPCGQYGIAIFGPAGSDGNRARLGQDFCAGSVTVVPVPGQDWPDLWLREGKIADPSGAVWHRFDERLRWSQSGWVLVLDP